MKMVEKKRKKSGRVGAGGRRMSMDDLLKLVEIADNLIIRCEKCGAKWGSSPGRWFFIFPDHGWYHACNWGKAVAKRKPHALTS
jgi:hypothetical protein